MAWGTQWDQIAVSASHSVELLYLLADTFSLWESILLSQRSPNFRGFLAKFGEWIIRWNSERGHSQLHPLVSRPMCFGYGEMLPILVIGLKHMSHPWGQSLNLIDIISHCNRHYTCIFNGLFQHSLRPLFEWWSAYCKSSKFNSHDAKPYFFSWKIRYLMRSNVMWNNTIVNNSFYKCMNGGTGNYLMGKDAYPYSE